MTRTPFSTRIPRLAEADDLITAQAIHYTVEYHRVANWAAEQGLIAPDDPGLCADALLPDAPVGAARPGLVAEVRAIIRRLREVAPAPSAPLARTLDAMERTLARHRRGPLAAALAADLARALERAMLLMTGPRDLSDEAGTLVARLSDTAVLTARHRRYNGYCSDLTAKSNYNDLRFMARSLARVGTLPANDPRARLSDECLVRMHREDVTEYIPVMLKGADEARPLLAPCGTKAYAPHRLRQMVNDLWDTMQQGLLLENEPGLEFMRALARTAEGIGMNLHLQGHEEHRDLVERLLTVSTLLIFRSYPIAHQIQCREAGVDPSSVRGGLPPEPVMILACIVD